MIRTQVYLTEEIKQELELLKKQEGTPMGKVIRKILNAVLIEEKTYKRKQRKGNGLLELARLAQKGRGPKDLSVKMDEYLYNR